MEGLVKRRRQEEHIAGCSLSEEVVLYEILPWVPLKSLLRFKLVSKEWCRAISEDPIFKSSQIHRSLTSSDRPPGGLLYYGDKELPLDFQGSSYLFFPTTMGGKQFASMPDESLKYMGFCCDGHLRASSNGLLCSYCTCSPPDNFFVTNPITREVISIPNLYGLEDIAIAFEPLASNPFFLLVSRLIFPAPHFTYTDIGFAVYSSETGLWTISSAQVRINIQTGVLLRQRPIYCGGKLCWKQGPRHLLWFDVEKDSAGVVDFPSSSDQKLKNRPYLQGEIGDCHGTITYTDITTEFLDIWFLMPNDCAWTWTNKYHLSIRQMLEHNLKEIPSCYQTMLSEICKGYRRPLPYDGGDLVLFWVSGVEGIGQQVILSYNLRTQFMHLILHSGIFEHTNLFPYTSTFASVPIPPMLNQCQRVSCWI